MASIGAKLEAAKAKKQHVFQGERVQAFSDASSLPSSLPLQYVIKTYLLYTVYGIVERRQKGSV